MAPTNPVIAGATLTAGLRSDFWETWRQTHEGVQQRLAGSLMMGVSSDKLTELYAYFESSPYPRRWPRGEEISSKSFKSVQFSVTNFDWGRRIGWNANDREDDQTDSLFEMARAAGENWATLPERIFYQVLLGSADSELLPAIPLDPTGVSLYSTTDSLGAARFGATGGNSLTGTGVATSGAVRDDFFSSVEQFRLFQNTEGQPLWNQSIIDSGLVVYFGVHNLQAFSEAFLRERTVEIVAGAGVGTPSNVIMASGLKVRLEPTSFIPSTNDDWFVFLEGSRLKAIFQQERQALREVSATFDNSDHVRGTKEEYIQWDSREGYGVNVPYQTCRIDN